MLSPAGDHWEDYEMSLVNWIKATRAPFFTAVVVPVCVGASLAWYQTGKFNPGYFFLTLAGVLFLHAGANMANDYFDHLSGADDINRQSTPFSGGSRVIQQGIMSSRQILLASTWCFVSGIGIGLFLFWSFGSPAGIPLLLLGIIGVLSGYFYTAPPLRTGYRGWGEFLVALNFGPLMVLGSYYVQSRSLRPEVLFASLPVAFLIAAVLYINQFPDYPADKAAGKAHLVVRLGRKRAVKGYYCLILLAYLAIILSIFLRMAPWTIAISLLTLPLAWGALKIIRKNFNRTQEMIPAMGLTILLHLFTGVLLSFGYVIAGISRQFKG